MPHRVLSVRSSQVACASVAKQRSRGGAPRGRAGEIGSCRRSTTAFPADRRISMKRVLMAAVTAAALVAAGGCGGSGDDNAGTTTTPSSSASAVAYPITVGDVTLDAQPTRIVSLTPTATEMLFAIGAGPQVVAVDDQSNYPANAPKTDLSGVKPNAEAIAAKNPDLGVLSNDTDKIVAQLGKLKTPVFLTPAATSMEDTYSEISELGTLTGHPAESAALRTQMTTQID